MQTIIERIQLEALDQLSRNPHKLIHRGQLATLFSVAPPIVDVAMKRCALVKREKIDSFICYGLAY